MNIQTLLLNLCFIVNSQQLKIKTVIVGLATEYELSPPLRRTLILQQIFELLSADHTPLIFCFLVAAESRSLKLNKVNQFRGATQGTISKEIKAGYKK